jgi:hypothetical protein
MKIDPDYDDYFVYTAAYHHGKQSDCGACPVVWEDDVTLQKKTLNWADGNYHLHNASGLSEKDVFVEDQIFSLLNEAMETSGKIDVPSSDSIVRWCLLEKEQMHIVMDIPQSDIALTT